MPAGPTRSVSCSSAKVAAGISTMRSKAPVAATAAGRSRRCFGNGLNRKRPETHSRSGLLPSSTPPPSFAFGYGRSPSPSKLGEELPDADALLGGQVHRIAGLDVERLVPGVDVAHDAVDAELGRAVRVGEQALAQRPFADVAPPGLGESQEEALVAGQAVDHRRLAVLGDVAAIRGVGHFEPAEVADILAERQLAVHPLARDAVILVVLLHQTGGALAEALRRGFGPPVA